MLSGYDLFKFRFQRLIDGPDGSGLGLDGPAVVGEQAVHLILHIGQLRVYQRREALSQLGQNGLCLLYTSPSPRD